MGGFFTNVQIYAGSRSPQDLLNETKTALQHRVTSEGFQEVVQDSQPADRTVFVGPPGGRWLSVYDEETENQDLERLTELARYLSKQVGTFTLAILVHDSDLLEMRLCRDGRVVDPYSSDSGYWDGGSGGKSRASRGHADRWRDVLVGGATSDDLKVGWRHDDIFVENTLKRIAALLGLDPVSCCLGFGSLDSVPETDLRTFASLRFQHPAHATSLAQKKAGIDALPRLSSMVVHGGLLECSIGDNLEDNLSHGTLSAGSASKGLEVMISGTSIRDGLVAIEQFELWGGEMKETHALLPEHRRDDQTMVVSLPEFQIPAAPPLSAKESVKVKEEIKLANGRTTTMSYETSSKEFNAARVGVRLKGTAYRVGSGTLAISLVPTTNHDEGRSTVPIDIEVFSSPRRPLKSLPPTPAISTYLRIMETPRALSALVVLGADRQTSAEVAMKAMARWHEVIADGRAVEYETVFSPTRGKIQSSKLGPKDIPSGRRWLKLRNELPSFISFEALHGWGVVRIGHKRKHTGSGFSFDAQSIFLEHLPDEQLVFVGFWLDLESQARQRVQSAEAELIEVVDRLMEEGRGIQAFVARWDWDPKNSEHTPYETACGVHGQHARSRGWCTRYMLAVTDHIWLGSELLTHLGTLSNVASVAQVRNVGSAVRATLGERHSLDDLEQAIAKLLPDETTWNVEFDRMRARRSREQGIGS